MKLSEKLIADNCINIKMLSKNKLREKYIGRRYGYGV